MSTKDEAQCGAKKSENPLPPEQEEASSPLPPPPPIRIRRSTELFSEDAIKTDGGETPGHRHNTHKEEEK